MKRGSSTRWLTGSAKVSRRKPVIVGMASETCTAKKKVYYYIKTTAHKRCHQYRLIIHSFDVHLFAQFEHEKKFSWKNKKQTRDSNQDQVKVSHQQSDDPTEWVTTLKLEKLASLSITINRLASFVVCMHASNWRLWRAFTQPNRRLNIIGKSDEFAL